MDDSSEDEDNASVVSEETNILPDPSDSHMDIDRYLTGAPYNIRAPAYTSPFPPVEIVHPSPQKCWLCTFSPHPTAVLMHDFIINNVPIMDVSYIASQIKDEIKTRFPHASGASRRDIIRHISEHMISPTVKIASTIRSLVTVAETLKAGLTHRDPETNEVLVDIKNTELYLKVVSQIVATYKLDGTKLLFGKQAQTQ
jgi:hypothetical protein